MKRIIGFDFGHKNIGVAISDQLKITAQPLTTAKVKDIETISDEIVSFFQDYDIELIVVGLPLNMNGSEGETAKEAREFAALLEKTVNVKSVMWDERLSSKTVERAMLEDNVRRRKRKKHKDVMAAVVILQNYLDFLSP